jgi:hypothetical protein
MEDYARAMLVYTQSQISSLVGLDELHGTSTRSTSSTSSISSGNTEGSDPSTNRALRHQDPGPLQAQLRLPDGKLQTAEIASMLSITTMFMRSRHRDDSTCGSY